MNFHKNIIKYFSHIESKIDSENNKITFTNFVIENLNIRLDNKLTIDASKIQIIDPNDIITYIELNTNINDIQNKYVNEKNIYLYPNSTFHGEYATLKKTNWIFNFLKNLEIALIELKIENEKK